MKDISPRVLVKWRYKGDIWGYRAQVLKNIRVGKSDTFEQEIIGYAEFPCWTRLREYKDSQKFKSIVEEISTRVLWFDEDSK